MRFGGMIKKKVKEVRDKRVGGEIVRTVETRGQKS